MTTNEKDSPFSSDGANESELGDLIEQVDDDHGEDGAAAMADKLRDKLPETKGEPEAPGDLED